MEDRIDHPRAAIRRRQQARLPAPLHQRGQVAVEGHEPAPPVLGGLGAEADDAALPIEVAPREGADLALAPARQVAEAGEVLQVGWERGHDGVKLLAFEEARSDILDLEAGDMRHRWGRREAAPRAFSGGELAAAAGGGQSPILGALARSSAGGPGGAAAGPPRCAAVFIGVIRTFPHR